jgi:predicted double-glycine peptidase
MSDTTAVCSRASRGRRLGAAALAAACLALSAQPAAAAQLLPLPTLQLRSNLGGMRALRYRDMVPQQRDYSCGAAALATLLDYGYGYTLDETQTIEAMMRHVDDPAVVLKSGFSMLDMKRYVDSLGLHAVGFQVNMVAMRRLRIPVIVLLEVGGYSHFVVVKKVDRDLVFISDPALGNRSIYVDAFARSWQGGLVLAVVGRPFRADSPLLRDNFARSRDARDALLHKPPAVFDFGISRFGRF